jgi:hypothetical protein
MNLRMRRVSEEILCIFITGVRVPFPNTTTFKITSLSLRRL